jgi:hypothetical protein
MSRTWLKGLRKYLLGTCAAFLVSTGVSRAQDKDADLRSLIEEQGRQIQELKKQLEEQKHYPVTMTGGEEPKAKKKEDKKQLDEDAVKKIVAGYLKDNPGAGMPSGVQTGYKWGQGFSISSAPNPGYKNWDDDSKLPFELRFRGRVQLDYYNYKVTDITNHVTNRPATQNANSVRQADFSQLEVKRLRLIWEGSAFDPNLKFNFTLDGNTRGLGGTQNNRVVENGGTFDPNGQALSPIGGGVTVDHAVRLFECWVAYDFHPCCAEKGCACDCPEGTYRYTPTYTLIAGKLKPWAGQEEYLGSGNEQMVEYSMADWFFSADDDNLLMGAGGRVRALDDRLYAMALITNGSESQFPNTQMDNLPGFNFGGWYDFGGTWDPDGKKWQLYGPYVSDLDYSCKPVVRIGGWANIVPLNRRSLYGDPEQSRIFVTPGGPQGGTRLINVLNGDSLTPNGSHAVDDFDYYTYSAFAGFKYRGFSVWTDWYLRVLNDFRTTPNGQGNIIYQDTLGNNALFPHHSLLDYGSTVQAGYFIVPKKLEVVGRFSFVRGDSGDVNGTGKFTTTRIPGVTTPVRVYDGAFRQYHEAREAAIGINYYFHGQLLKWQTDFSVYDGGNPSGGGQSPAGFIAGSDGYMLRTQIQMWF